MKKKLKIEDDKRHIPREDLATAITIDYELIPPAPGQPSPLAAKVMQNEIDKRRGQKKRDRVFPQDIHKRGNKGEE